MAEADFSYMGISNEVPSHDLIGDDVTELDVRTPKNANDNSSLRYTFLIVNITTFALAATTTTWTMMTKSVSQARREDRRRY